MLSHLLDIRMVATVQTQSYNSQHQQEAVTVINSPYPWYLFKTPPEVIIIVDDLIDTGDTIKTVEYWVTTQKAVWHQPQLVKAVAFAKEGRTVDQALVGMVVPNKWLVFPYEKDE